MSLSVEPARFDWYAATVETSPETLTEVASTVLADEAPVLVRGRNSFGHGWELRRDGSRAAVVYGGGSSEWPHIEGTGPDAVAVARLLRSREWPHRVSRADVCVDTDTPGAFAVMLDGLRAVKGAATKAHMYLPDDDAHGRTYYVGAKTSEVQARLYEKGKQLPEAGRPDWVRYEVQIRPQKDRKAWAASTSASDLLGAARWSERFVTEVLGVAASAAPTRSERVSDLEGAIAAMCHQYGNRLLELVESHGGDVEAFGLELLARAQNGGKLPA